MLPGLPGPLREDASWLEEKEEAVEEEEEEEEEEKDSKEKAVTAMYSVLRKAQSASCASARRPFSDDDDSVQGLATTTATLPCSRLFPLSPHDRAAASSHMNDDLSRA
jgi:hypothetical protein